MTRARAVALSLVNWKGVFFERYWLDRHVTALEGANGAGKTTVMIAAYVVLLPDLQRLKFVNLGETGATAGDRGIWGRLGESGPSYAALEIDVGSDQRVLCGVHLERKAAPALSLTPFLITQIPEPITSQRLLLADKDHHEEVPNLAELARSVAAAGATLEVFGSAKDYFARSFELGISPLRLSTDEDRNKLNDMLRTSMTGGISRTLTSDLRSFLFKRETGLFDILSRMRQNLEACRRTRLDVGEARGLEHEISGVYATGHAMFGAALEASRVRARESRRRLDLAEQARTETEQRVFELETLLDEVAIRKDSLSTRLAHARKAADAGRERLARLTRASAAAQRVTAAQAERDRCSIPAERALEQKARAQALREAAKAARDAAQATLLRATTGLASLQTGLEELHRQSHAFGRVRERLAAALRDLSAYVEHTRGADRELGDVLASLTALQDSQPAPHQLKDALARVDEARAGVDRERAEQHRRDATTEQRRKDFAAAAAALGAISELFGTHSDPTDSAASGAGHALGDRARRELSRLNELDVLATRVDELEREWQRLSALGRRQAALESGLSAIGFVPLPSAHEFASKLGSLEQKRRELERTQQEHELTAARELERVRAMETAFTALVARAERYARLCPARERIHARGRPMPESANDLAEQLRGLEETRRTWHETTLRCETERKQALRLALDCEASATGARSDLEQLAERIDGQLLTARYEDLEIDEARRTQAELGPLNAAIVVDDPHAALALICAEPHLDESVWLIRTDASASAIGKAVPSEQPGHVVVDLGYGLRVTRLPEAVHLGKAARERRARELRSEADAKQRELESAEARLRELDAQRRDLSQLWEHWEVWSNGDPSGALDSAGAELKQTRARISECQSLARQARLDAARVLSEYEAAKVMLGDHHLLDPPNYVQAADAVRQTLEVALRARTELARVATSRKLLLGHLHLLDEGPPGAHDRGAAAEAAEKSRLDAQRDRLFAATDALRALDKEQAAWRWSDAERALGEQTRLAPELQAQHQRAEADVRRAHEDFEIREAAWEAAALDAQRLSAELAAADAHLLRARAEFEAEGIERPSELELGQYQLELSQLDQTVERLDAEARGIDAELALAHERCNQARQRLEQSGAELARERELAEPAERAWRELERAALGSSGFSAEAESGNAAPATSSAQLWLEAQSKRALLADRLLAARDAADLARACTETWPVGVDIGPRYFELWQAVQSWLARRLPARLGELGEPLQGLSRLSADLGQLERRLERQEGDLRGTSGDVARSIDVQVRRAAAQVRRLNASLDGVSFGSIHGIRVQMERVAKMDQVLSALRDGETQELLFQSDLPFEAALDEIFRRHSGGRSGGQRLIDYREYIELCVSIQRRPDADWERVNPSQVSTGEAIGIGAALMMVILTEWERDDQLLRQKRSLGSLRFLFLDEANRLSRDNLGVLFDLCRTLDLQLLIAAPEVARAEGNTTYRLVRRVNEAGREEVLVSGRRSTPPDPDPHGGRDAAPVTQVRQTQLFSE